jgi:hypothetical protein
VTEVRLARADSVLADGTHVALHRDGTALRKPFACAGFVLDGLFEAIVDRFF